MKKSAIVVFFLTILVLTNKTSKGQTASVVTDPASYGYLSQSVASAAESAEKLGKSLQYLEDAKNALDKVNGGLQASERIRNIILNQRYMIANTKSSYRTLEASGQFTPAELAYVMGSFSNLISRSQRSLEFAKNVGQDNMLKMNDNERLNWLQDVEHETDENSHEAYYLDQKYQRMRRKKELVNTFGQPSSAIERPSTSIRK